MKLSIRIKQNMLLAVMSLLCLVGCAHEEEAPAPRTLLVYLAGDNNLSGETDAKLENIAKGWDGRKGHLIVYQDRQNELPRLIELKAGGKFSTVRTYGEPQNSCSPELFKEVIHEVVGRYPALDYGLLYFSHGTGWLPKGNYPRPETRTIGMDGNDEMSLADFAAAIPDGQFRFIVFETCLMAGIEVAYELKDKTQTLVASSAEILSPGFTELYPQIIPMLFEPNPDLEGLAHLYFSHWNAKKGFYRSATISVIQTGGLEYLAGLIQPVVNNGVPVQPETVTCFDSGTAFLYSDLGEYLKLKCTEDGQWNEIAKQLKQVVTYCAATPQVMGTIRRNHSGLTIYLPRAGYEKLNMQYRLTHWSRSIYPVAFVEDAEAHAVY